jgi:hypothetical protein
MNVHAGEGKCLDFGEYRETGQAMYAAQSSLRIDVKGYII